MSQDWISGSLILIALSLLTIFSVYVLKIRGIPYIVIQNPYLFIINMDRSCYRWERIKNLFARNNIRLPDRFPGIDGSQWRSLHKDWDPKKRDNLIKKGVMTNSSKLTVGQVGCATAHAEVWRHIINKQISWAVIFEDDIDIIKPNNNTNIFSKFLDIPEDADIVFLNNRYFSFPPKFIPFYKNKRKPFFGCGNEGYLISYRGAEKALKIISPLYTTNDVQLLHYFSNIKLIDQVNFFLKPKRELINAYLLNSHCVIENDEGISETDIIDGLHISK